MKLYCPPSIDITMFKQKDMTDHWNLRHWSSSILFLVCFREILVFRALREMPVPRVNL